VLADEDGRHVFAVTEEQHLQNVQKAIQAGIL
jgi:cell division protein YceG involved in septum cleavage